LFAAQLAHSGELDHGSLIITSCSLLDVKPAMTRKLTDTVEEVKEVLFRS
jgi:hypothetical protein